MAADTLPRVLRAAADRFGDHPAVVDGDVTLGFADLLEQVREVARGYVRLGLGPGDRVAVWAPNTWRWEVAALAVSYAGGVLVPLNTRYTGHEVVDVARPGAGAPRRRRRRLPRPAPERRSSPRPPPRRGSTCPPSSRSGAGDAVLDWPDRDDVPRRGRRRGAGRRRAARRRRRHPLHLRHDRPQQGRHVGAPADRRGRPGVGRARRGRRSRPLPRGQPVLPLLRLQGRHRGQPAHRRHRRADGGLRHHRPDAAHRGARHHRAARAPRPSTRPCSRRPTATTSTCRPCGSPSPAPPSSRSPSSSGCRPRWASTSCSPPSG